MPKNVVVHYNAFIIKKNYPLLEKYKSKKKTMFIYWYHRKEECTVGSLTRIMEQENRIVRDIT